MTTSPQQFTISNDSDTNNSASSKTNKSSTLSLLITGLIVLGIVLSLRFYIVKPFIVSGVSMYPTFNSWHYLIIDEFTYNFMREPQRGEVIVFHYPKNTKRYFIKRVIGLPGETVSIHGTKVSINNSAPLDEPYIAKNKEKIDDISIKLANDEYFVMGDNRKESADSRYWGPLKRKFIVGRVLTRLFPFSKLGWLPGSTTYALER